MSTNTEFVKEIIIRSKHPIDHYKATKNHEAVWHALMWNKPQDLLFSKKIRA